MKKYLLFLLPLFLSSCLSFFERPVNIDTFTDPEYRNKKFRKLLINFTSENFKVRQKIELKAQASFINENLLCFVYHELFYPTRTYNEDEQIEIMKKSGIDGVINIEYSYFEYEDVPNETGSIDKKPYMHISFSLVDINNGKKAWIADVTNGGNAFEDLEDIEKEIYRSIARKLLAECMINKSNTD